jgi:hypothetical protein
MGTGYTTKLDLNSIFDIYQNTALRYGKELIVSTLQEVFSRDSYYHYQRDVWGFPKIPDHTNLPLGTGVHDDITSRLYIGEKWPYNEGIYYPCLLISAGGANYVPISFNRDKYAVQWKPIVFEDGYGKRKIYSIPDHFIQVGALEFSIDVNIHAKDTTSRDELHDILMPIFYDIEFDNLKNSGLVILKVSSGGPSEKGDRNDQIYQQTITLNCRGEFRRQIPIGSVIDRINFCLDFANLEKDPPEIAENLRIQTDVDLLDYLANL